MPTQLPTRTQRPALPRLRAGLGGMPRAFWVLCAGTLVNRAGTMVQPFFALYLTTGRGFSTGSAGLLLALFAVGALLSQVLAGWLADRFGRRSTLLGGMLASAALMVALALSSSIPAFAVELFLLGLAIDVYRPASSALVADLIPERDRTRAYSLLFWAVNLGYTAGVLTGGLLVRFGFSWLFWVDAVSCAAFGIMVRLAVPETAPPPGTAPHGSGSGFGAVLRDRVMCVFVLITGGYAFVYLQTMSTLPLAMRADGLSPAAFGTAMAVNGVVISIVQPLAVVRLSHWNRNLVLTGGMLLVGLGFGLNALVSSPLGYSSTTVVWSLGEIAFTGASAATAVALAPAHLRGRYSGVYGSAWSLGGLPAPVLGAWLLGHGSTLLWLVCAAIGLCAAVGQILIGPAVTRRTAAAATDPDASPQADASPDTTGGRDSAGDHHEGADPTE
ncbi:MDR family MFS transporter [Kitasatospora sp. NBC_00315]|uniref:MDR family MFS transporter n=1 Tax=Kitasatospora sp. NBC_00315 TaxID=2975963 RepID=UPI00324E8F7F